MDGTTRLRRLVMPTSQARQLGNVGAIASELDWLRRVIEHRLQQRATPDVPEAPEIDPEGSYYGDVVERCRLGQGERLMLILALAPHVRPQALDALFGVTGNNGRGTEVGGLQGRAHGGFLPTGETALYLLAGEELQLRFETLRYLDPDQVLFRTGWLTLDEPPAGEPRGSGLLAMSQQAVSYLTSGTQFRPEFGRDFPARLLTTDMAWEDLVLVPSTREQLQEFDAWARHERRLREGAGLARRLRGGYRALFYGPPGTGKTLTATLLGKRLKRDVYRVALSAVVSKYVGETAKNLERLFERAEPLNCILFFDEADSLFGKRAAVTDARDRYANQEVSYLLQRIEDYRGIVVLATNFESNVDEAFLRRFHAVVHFPLPGVAERRRLWNESLPAACRLGKDVDLDVIAGQSVLSGGAIVNAVQYAALMALDRDAVIAQADLLAGVRRELQKEGKSL